MIIFKKMYLIYLSKLNKLHIFNINLIQIMEYGRYDETYLILYKENHFFISSPNEHEWVVREKG